MYEIYTKQALPSKAYRELIGSAICVFNSNNSFIIENILKKDSERQYSWYKLIDLQSGQLSEVVKKTISRFANSEIASLFSEIILKRNRIIHSFQITKGQEQILATKDKENKQFIITENYLLDFIKDNEELSGRLNILRR